VKVFNYLLSAPVRLPLEVVLCKVIYHLSVFENNGGKMKGILTNCSTVCGQDFLVTVALKKIVTERHEVLLPWQ